MILPMITGYAAATLGILQISLMIPVGNARRKHGISVGDMGNQELIYKIRRHGNFVENAPMFLILICLLEILGGPNMVIITLAVIFIVTRLSHAYSISGPGKPVVARGIGAVGTLISIVGASGMLFWQLSIIN